MKNNKILIGLLSSLMLTVGATFMSKMDLNTSLGLTRNQHTITTGTITFSGSAKQIPGSTKYYVESHTNIGNPIYLIIESALTPGDSLFLAPEYSASKPTYFYFSDYLKGVDDSFNIEYCPFQRITQIDITMSRKTSIKYWNSYTNDFATNPTDTVSNTGSFSLFTNGNGHRMKFTAQGTSIYENACTNITLHYTCSTAKYLEEGISVSGSYKRQYLLGEEFSTENLNVVLQKSDGSTENVTKDASFSGFDSSTEGEKTITVSYHDLSTQFTVSVVSEIVSYPFIGKYEFKNTTYEHTHTLQFLNGQSGQYGIDGVTAPFTWTYDDEILIIHTKDLSNYTANYFGITVNTIQRFTPFNIGAGKTDSDAITIINDGESIKVKLYTTNKNVTQYTFTKKK